MSNSYSREIARTINTGFLAMSAEDVLHAIADQWADNNARLEWLEDWAHRAAQELTEFVDAAREAADAGEAEADILPGVQALLDEFDEGNATIGINNEEAEPA